MQVIASLISKTQSYKKDTYSSTIIATFEEGTILMLSIKPEAAIDCTVP